MHIETSSRRHSVRAYNLQEKAHNLKSNHLFYLRFIYLREGGSACACACAHEGGKRGTERKGEVKKKSQVDSLLSAEPHTGLILTTLKQ